MCTFYKTSDLIPGGFPVDQARLRIDRAVVQGRLFDPGDQKVYCRKSHDLTVDMDGSQGWNDDLGTRRIIKTAQAYISGNDVS